MINCEKVNVNREMCYEKRGGVRSSFDTSCHEASVQHQVTNVLVFCEKWKSKKNFIFIPVFFFKYWN